MSSSSGSHKVIGSYRLLKNVGEGGMAQVFKAEHLADHTIVALKVFRATDIASPAFLKRVKREIVILKQCAHPGIVKVHGFSLSGKLAFLALHFVEGDNLQDLVTREGPFSPDRILRVARDIGGALAYCHARGLFHRDIKPANIILEGGTGRAILLDFGIVKAVNATDISAMNEMRGTLMYMAPEQFRNEPVDGRSDLYQLGLVLVKLATGREPFDMTQLLSMMEPGAQRPVPPIRELVPELPEAVETIILNCLHPSREDRYPSAHHFLTDVEQALRGQQVVPLTTRRRTLRMPVPELSGAEAVPIRKTMRIEEGVSQDLRGELDRVRRMRQVNTAIVALVVALALFLIYAS